MITICVSFLSSYIFQYSLKHKLVPLVKSPLVVAAQHNTEFRICTAAAAATPVIKIINKFKGNSHIDFP